MRRTGAGAAWTEVIAVPAYSAIKERGQKKSQGVLLKVSIQLLIDNKLYFMKFANSRLSGFWGPWQPYSLEIEAWETPAEIIHPNLTSFKVIKDTSLAWSWSASALKARLEIHYPKQILLIFISFQKKGGETIN